MARQIFLPNSAPGPLDTKHACFVQWLPWRFSVEFFCTTWQKLNLIFRTMFSLMYNHLKITDSTMLHRHLSTVARNRTKPTLAPQEVFHIFGDSHSCCSWSSVMERTVRDVNEWWQDCRQLCTFTVLSTGLPAFFKPLYLSRMKENLRNVNQWASEVLAGGFLNFEHEVNHFLTLSA